MLAQLQSLLLKYNYISRNDACYISGRLLGNWGVLIYTSSGKYFHIKAETQSMLALEYKHLTKVYKKYFSFMAQPLGYHELEGRRYIINQAIAHEPLSAQKFLNNINLQESLAAYFSLSLEKNIPIDNTQEAEQRPFILSLLYNPQIFIYPQHIDHVQSLYQKLMTYGSSEQHGDFVLNNLGVHDDQIIIFDWEDYGRIQLPGFDLVTFLISLFHFDIDKLVEELYLNPTIQRCTKPYMTYLDCSIEEFIEYMPLYLYAFLYIKQQFGYSKDSIQRTQKSISQLYKLKQVAV